MRRVPVVIIFLAVLFNLWTLRAEREPVPHLNDGAMHTQMIRWAAERLDAGHLPLDGWFPNFALGSAQFHHYPSVPHLLMAPAARFVDAEAVYSHSVYLLLVLWPLAVYFGARGFGWDRLGAACAALLAPLITSVPGYGFEYDSYTWRGLGVYSQLWGMLFLPIAWRAVWTGLERGTGSIAWAAAATAITVALNYQTGYLALACLGAWTLVVAVDSLKDRRAVLVALGSRLVRGSAITAGALLLSAWVLVPLLVDRQWTNLSPAFVGEFWLDSFGAARVLSWLGRGELFDGTRFPVITLLVAFGVVVSFWRGRRTRGTVALGIAGALSLFFFIGRPTWGGVMDILPGGQDLMLHRFLGGIQLAGAMFAGAGLAFLLRALLAAVRDRGPIVKRALPALGAVIALGALAIPLQERLAFHRDGAQWLREGQSDQVVAEREGVTKLLAVARAGDGRTYGGSWENWGTDYKVGRVPMYAELANQDVDAIGFTYRTLSSLSTDVEPLFDEARWAHVELFGVRYLILPAGREPAVEASLVDTAGPHSLWRVPGSGYMQVVDTAGILAADRSSIAAASADFLASERAAEGLYPVVEFDGRPAGPLTYRGAGGGPGAIEQMVARPNDGHFVARVRTTRAGVVLLKSSFHPRWSATVDGRDAEPFMVAPSFMGVQVGPGEHVAEFRYVPFEAYGLLFAMAALALAALVALDVGLLGRLGLRRRLAGRALRRRDPLRE